MTTSLALSQKPQSAWLLMLDEASLMELELDVSEGVLPDNCWTCSPYIEPGDLLFFYVMAPFKEIRYVARATSRPFVDTNIEVLTHKSVHAHQWWVSYDHVVQIAPISLKRFRDLHKQDLIMRGRNGKVIRPEIANQMIRDATSRKATPPKAFKHHHIASTLQKVVGRGNLPDPKNLTFDAWKSLNTAPLLKEVDVERHLLEPLFQRILGLPQAYQLIQKFKVERKTADYVITHHKVPCCIVECKLRARFGPKRIWKNSPDVIQAKNYALPQKFPYIVFDNSEIFCFKHGKVSPVLVIERSSATKAQLTVLKRFIRTGSI